ncbi:MAG: winged helix DNA-binding protein [Novosphingobium sp.]
MRPRRQGSKAADKGGLSLSWAEIGRFAEAIHNAREELLTPAQEISERFSLGPRGIWIIGLVATGRIRTPSDVAKLYRIGRSMVTEQIGLLIQQGLIVSEQSKDDRRKKDISLTELGWSVNRQLGDAFTAKLQQRLGGYTAKEINFCIDLLFALAGDRSLDV